VIKTYNSIARFIILLFSLLIIFTGSGRAQKAPLWRGLEPGPNAVGFKVLWKYDYSRTLKPEKDYKGNLLPGEAARSVRISVWYPAQKSAQAAPMLYSGYLNVQVPDQSFADFNQRVEDYDYKSVRNYFQSQALFDKLLKTATPTYLDARPSKGTFPLVVFSLGQNDHTLENIVLWEFLASHGYVVATVPHIGTSLRRFQLLVHDPLMYEAQVRDLEFVIQQMHSTPYVNADKLALMGHSFGGIYSLLVAMRNTKVDAVVGLDPTYMSKQPSFHYKFWEAPYYDTARLKAPMLVLYKGIESENLRMDIVNDLKFSDRYLYKFPYLVHGDFNSSPMITALAPGDDYADREYALKYRPKEAGIVGHQIVCRYVLNFLNAFLKDNAQALRFINSRPVGQGAAAGIVERDFKVGLKAPTEEEFYTIIREQGIDSAIKLYREAQAKYPQETIIRESALRRIGNEAGYYGNPAQAVEVFQLYVEAYPRSAAAYDSLAGAYEAVGNKELAIRNYERSLEYNPDNANARERLKNLRK
jgi:dienelactone hydrolase